MDQAQCCERDDDTLLLHPGSALSVMVMHSQSCFAGRAPRHITVFGGGAQGVFHAAHLYALFRNARCDARSGAIHIDFVTRSSWADEERAAKKLIMQHAGTRAVVIGHVLSNDRTSVESSTRSAEIIVTCTSSSEPLFDDDWVQPGAHLVLIGSCELNCPQSPIVSIIAD